MAPRIRLGRDLRAGDRGIGLPGEVIERRPSGRGCRDRLGIPQPACNQIELDLDRPSPWKYAEYLRMPAHHALKIPDGLDLKLAAPPSHWRLGAHANRAAGGLSWAFGVLIIGASPIGLPVFRWRNSPGRGTLWL